MDELQELKSVLRSLVVSTPLQLTVAALLRDYRALMGVPLPYAKHGYYNPATFLKERCGDCFRFQGSGNNPVLIPIVTEELKHIDKFVRKQKIPSNIKFKGKRGSINESYIQPAPDLIAKTFTKSYNSSAERAPPHDAGKGAPSQRVEADKWSGSGSSSGTSGVSSGEGSVRNFLRKRMPALGARDEPWDPADSASDPSYEAEQSVPPPRAASPPAPSPPPAPPAARPLSARTVVRPPPAPAPPLADPDDALPYVDFDPDVFPADCLSFAESIPRASLAALAPGDMVELMVGEVYSPSHFWFYRLGADHHIALEDMMDEMTRYYRGEGAGRSLCAGAARPGAYCSAEYERDWHRSLVVRALDCDTVKVLHVDYGTVERVSVRALKPLLRRWARLPAQALRARLACVRPVAGGRRWPRQAAAAFLRLVRDRPLVGNIVRYDAAEEVAELILVDTSGARDVRLDEQLVAGGHADPAPAAAGAASYLLPRWEALESGATPSYADLHAYLRDGIVLDCVDEYRRHVASAVAREPDHPEHPEPPEPRPSVAALPSPPPVRAPMTSAPPIATFAPTSPTFTTAARPPTSTPTIAPSPRGSSHPPRSFNPPPPKFPAPAPMFPGPVPTFHPLPFPPPGPVFIQPAPVFIHPAPLFANSTLNLSQPTPMFSQSSLELAGPPPTYTGPLPTFPRAGAAGALDNRVPLMAPALKPGAAGGGAGAGAGVTLSAAECAVFSLLSRVDTDAAHWYMVEAINRAAAAAPPPPPPPPPPPQTPQPPPGYR